MASVARSPTVRFWRCPRCRGDLFEGSESLGCAACGSEYPRLAGIPDLRVNAPAWVEPDADRACALELLALPETTPAVDLAYRVFRRRPGWTDRDARLRAAQAMAQPERIDRELDGWLGALTALGGPVLDLGCGSGGLLAAAARRGISAAGVDVSLEWLVVAARLIAEHGGTPRIAAAMAEALPLPDASVAAVVSLDVIEHVGNQAAYLREIDRVVAGGGVCAIATPNRFSFTPEPHVGIWGVGWLPRKWQRQYVRWKGGKPYDYCVLLSAPELRRLFAAATSLHPRLRPGVLPSDELARFSGARRAAAHVYNLIAASAAAPLILPLCPFFQVVARKPDA